MLIQLKMKTEHMQNVLQHYRTQINMCFMFRELLWGYFAFNCEVSITSTEEKLDWCFHYIECKQHDFTVETLIKLDSQIH